MPRPFSLTLIHPSAWKRNSANFSFRGFYEVRPKCATDVQSNPRMKRYALYDEDVGLPALKDVGSRGRLRREDQR